MISQRQRGDGKVGCILWLAAALVFALIVWKAVPVKILSAEFDSYMVEQAKFAGRAPAELLKSRIQARAEEVGIPLDPKNLTVKKVGGRVRINCFYTIPVEFPFYTFNWEFEHNIDRPVFVI